MVQVNIRQMLGYVSVSCAAIALCSYAYNRSRHSELAKEQLLQICEQRGGTVGFDVVDGDVIVNLSGTHLTQTDIATLPKLFERYISSDIGIGRRVQLNLNNATFDGERQDLLGDYIVGLSLAGLDFDDAELHEIVRICPRIERLDLQGTKISAKSIIDIASLPVGHLNIRDTHLSCNEIAQLGNCQSLYKLDVSVPNDEFRKLEEVLPLVWIENETPTNCQ
ncbi:MAG: hypothetical protein KDA42_06065 [Planctomycetales bacterium]|nr:hypothetical protein [Planctomycetales bacterium]